MIVIDGSNMVFGRLASKIAKHLLNNEEVSLINAENILMSGNPKALFERYATKRGLKYKGNPEKSPQWPRVPRMFVKRIIRGMLPWKKPKGREAFKRLKVYEGSPAEIKGEMKSFDDCKPKNITKFTTIGKLCRMFGYGG